VSGRVPAQLALIAGRTEDIVAPRDDRANRHVTLPGRILREPQRQSHVPLVGLAERGTRHGYASMQAVEAPRHQELFPSGGV
jgi:hypothetical protein